MELGAFRSFKMALGMATGSGEEQRNNDLTSSASEKAESAHAAPDDNGEDDARRRGKRRTSSGGSSASSGLSSNRSRKSSGSHDSGVSGGGSSGGGGIRSRSSTGSSSSTGPQRSRSRAGTPEVNLPLGRDFVPLLDDESEASRSRITEGDVPSAEDVDKDADADRARDEIRQDVVCMIFDLPKRTKFYTDFSCAIASAFAMHGRMYPTDTHVCFYSNVFGRERKIRIPYEDIMSIAKTTNLVFQGAIRITTSTAEGEYTFTSFWGSNRDRCYDLLVQRHQMVVGAAPPKSSPTGSTTIDASSATEEGSGSSSRDYLSDAGPRPAPRDISMEVLLEASFPVTVDEFLARFIRDDATFSLQAFHERLGATEFRCDPWTRPQGEADDDCELGQTRSLQFRVPIDAPIGPKSSQVDVLQCLNRIAGGGFTIESSTRLVDIPYGDYFSVEDRWTLTSGSAESDSCALRIELKVDFSKSTFWRSQIESRAIGDNRVKWQRWVAMASEHLQPAGPSPEPSSSRPSPPPKLQAETEPTSFRRPSRRSQGSRRRHQERSSLRLIPLVVIVVLVGLVAHLYARVRRMEALVARIADQLHELQPQAEPQSARPMRPAIEHEQQEDL